MSNIILFVIALLIAFEGLFISILPKATKKIITSMGKNLERLRLIGIIEFIIGILLVLISIFTRLC